MKKSIMIVDDSATLRQVVGVALEGAGYDVLDAVDGKDAMDKLDGRKIHLIICDVNMHNMDGISFLKQMKAMPNYNYTPVIMLTTEAGEAKKQEGRCPCLGGQAISACPDAGSGFKAGSALTWQRRNHRNLYLDENWHAEFARGIDHLYRRRQQGRVDRGFDVER